MQRVLLSLLSTIYFFCGTVSAQYYLPLFSPSINDARARALGHTEILNNTGPSSLAVNPANLAYIDKLTMEVSGKASWGLANGGGNSEYGFYPRLSSFAIARPFSLNQGKLKFTAGLIYNAYFDLGYKFTNENASSISGYNIKIKSKTDGGLNMLGIGIAGTIFDKLHFGIGIHRSLFSSIKTHTDYVYTPPISSEYEQAWNESSTKTQCYFLTFGQIWELNEKISIGLMYRSDMRYKYRDGKYEVVYSDGDSYEAIYTDMDWNIPSYVGAALNYKYSPQTLLSLEYQNRPFAGIQSFYYDNYWYTDDLSNSFYKQFSGACYRLGFEISNPVTFRFGLFGDNVIAIVSNSDYPGWIIGGDFGIGYTEGNFTYDLYTEYSSMRPTWPNDYDEDWYGIGAAISYALDL